jgi:hypothetical protein
MDWSGWNWMTFPFRETVLICCNWACARRWGVHLGVKNTYIESNSTLPLILGLFLPLKEREWMDRCGRNWMTFPFRETVLICCNWACARRWGCIWA